jgi:hypothetical protein
VKKKQEITSANVPSPGVTGSRWRKRVKERVILAQNLGELRRLRRMEFRFKNAPPGITLWLLVAIGYIAGWLVGAGKLGQ